MPTTTISNHIVDMQGFDIANISVVITLRPNPCFRISDGVELTGRVLLNTDTGGDWSTVLEETSNITPANSYYIVEEFIPKEFGGPRIWMFQVPALDSNLKNCLLTAVPRSYT